MFTGLVEALGRIARIDDHGRDRRLRIEPEDGAMPDIEAGESIAVSGPCLTAVDPDGYGFSVDVSAETLERTALGQCSAGARVNLERALLATSRLGGHLVTGHIDGVGRIASVMADGHSRRLRVDVPGGLERYLAAKGSVCVDGVSLTVNAVADTGFEVNVIPHTLNATTLGEASEGGAVNIEVDLLARYLERLLQQGTRGDEAARDRPSWR